MKTKFLMCEMMLRLCLCLLLVLSGSSAFAGTTATIKGAIAAGVGTIKATVSSTDYDLNGTVSSPVSITIGRDSSVFFTFTPAANNAIQKVMLKKNTLESDITAALTCPSGVSSACTYTVGDTNDDTYLVTVTYVTNYTVTSTVSGSGGSVSPASQSVANGTTTTVTVSPDIANKYAVQSIRINSGANLLSQPSFSVVTQSVGPVTANTTLTASFVPYYNITVTQPANCTILYNGVQPLGGVAKVISGETATFSIVPAVGATIDQVTYNGASVGAVSSYTTGTVTADKTLTATCSLATTDANNYTITPPFVSSNIAPNLLLLIDNSASMYDMSYDATGKCYDTSYSTAASYPGYFDETAVYSYNSTTLRFESGATLPGSCTFKADDFCVTMNTASPRAVTTFVAKGKFLNWLVTSKLDMQKKILTGGKYDTASGTLQSESRGCMGRRFVRIVSNTLKASGSAEDLDKMTFAIRGPTASEPDYINPATQGGTTRIEIYDGKYNLTACSEAVSDWSNITEEKLGQVQQSTTDCLACSGSSCNSSAVLKSETYIHMVHDCYWYYNNHKMSNLTTFKKDCEDVYDELWPGDITAPARITNELSGEAVCSSVIAHPYYTGLTLDGFTYVPNSIGFLGRCVTLTAIPARPGEFSHTWDDTCLNIEGADFCEGMRSSDVTDPSGTGNVTTGTSTSVPSFVIDAGVNALGVIAGSYFANVKQTTAPSGLVQEFKDYIRFGAMVFNQDGAGTECDIGGTNITCARHCSTTTTTACNVNADCPSPQTCILNDKLDGGKVISYLGYDLVGDHSTGLIKSIDGIQGTSWTPFAESYYNAIGYFASRTDLRLQTADFDETKVPADVRCRANNILIISDGGSTADQNASVSSLVSTYNDGDGKTDTLSTACAGYAGSRNLDDLAWLAYNKNIKDFSKLPTESSQKIKTYVVYNGLAAATTTDECLPANLMNETAKNGGTTSAYIAGSYDALLTQMRAAFRAIAGGSASGTAASILSNSEGSGANILQAVFYPLKEFETQTKASWIGEMQNLWYYVDPYIGNSTVREDTDYSSGDHVFDIKKDYVTQFWFNPDTNETKAKLYVDSDGDGSGNTLVTSADDTRILASAPGIVNADDVRSIWRAGKLLWERDISATPRKLYTYLAGATATGCTGSFSTTGLVDLVSFNWTADANNSCILKKMLNAVSEDDAKNIIRYVHGEDGLTIAGAPTRSRSVKIGGTTKVWKLGDIISSTPRVQSTNKLNNYHQSSPVGYADLTYADDTTGTGFANSTDYKNRGMVYAGANDGMMHAFNMGKLSVQSTGDIKATLSGTDLGKEQWNFIPKHALPYLKYLADQNYNHLYLVDGPSKIIDASIGSATLSGDAPYTTEGGCNTDYSGDALDGSKTVKNYWACKRDNAQADNKSWRTILIGSMGTGGAAANSSSSCSTTTECVKTPVSDVGFSSYYALDITDPAAPTFLWEFTADDLGYSTTGAAVVRIAHSFVGLDTATYSDTNGRWFAIIGNGPTGPIDTTKHQFMGVSTNPVKLYVLDLRSGTKIKELAPATALTTSFVGSIAAGSIDIHRSEKTSTSFYSDDAVYAGYVQCTANCATATPAWDGGLLRLFTNDKITPKDWDVTTLISGTGPVTAAVAKLQDRKNKKLWLYFGGGRYFFKDDDKATRRKLFGITEPCYYMNASYAPGSFKNDTCKNTISYSSGDFIDQTTLQLTPDFAGKVGWFIDLNVQDTDNFYGAERVITDPVAMPNGAVFFTTYMPSTDACNFGGKSYMWGLQYNTGGVASSKALQGKALVQVSTGSFEEINLSSALTAEGGRKMATPMTGKPPTDPPPIVSAAGNKPLKRIIHVQEK